MAIMIIRKTYKHGGSTSINLPAVFGIKPDTHMIVEKSKNGITIKRLEK